MRYFSKLPFVFVLSLALCVTSLIFAAISHRALIGDGSNWFFHIINDKKFVFDEDYCRYLDLLWQLPAWLIVNFMDGDVTGLALGSLDFAYGMHPILSLVATAWILYKKDRLSYLVFPALSLATATLSTAAFATGLAANALTVFWPLLALMLFAKKISLKEQIAMILLTAGLAFSYEPAIILFGLLFVVSFLNFQGWRWPLLFSAGFFWFAYRLLSPATQHLRGNFHSSLSNPLDTFRIFTFAVLAVFIIAFLIGRSRWGWKIVWFLLGICVSMFLYYSYVKWYYPLNIFYVGPTTAYSSRVTAIPVGFVIATLMVAVSWWLKEKELFFSKNFFRFAGIVILASSYMDFARTVRWNKARHYLINYVTENPGCSNMPRAEFVENFLMASLSDYGLAHAAVLFQGQKEVKAVVFVDSEEPSSIDPCKDQKDGFFRTAQKSEMYTKGYFDFSKVLAL